MIDLSIGLGIPLVQMPLRKYSYSGVPISAKSHIEYVVQGNRFDIYEDVGCYHVTYPTWVAWVVVYSWPLIISFVAFIYGCELSFSLDESIDKMLTF